MIKYYILSSAILTALAISCGTQSDLIAVVEEKDMLPADSIDNMLDIIAFVDSANVVESVKEQYVAMKEENEALQEELVEVKEELTITTQHLEKAKEIISSSSITDTVKSNFELLPISKANYN